MRPQPACDDPMTPETLTALKDSIAHWTRLTDGTEREGEEPYADDCALCTMFYDSDDDDVCVSCPIRLRTGRRGCRGSPYLPAERKWKGWKYGTGSEATFREAAADMRDYLIDLIPEGEKP